MPQVNPGTASWAVSLKISLRCSVSRFCSACQVTLALSDTLFDRFTCLLTNREQGPGVEIRTYTRLATKQHSFPQFTHWYIHRPTSEQSTHGCQNDQSSRRNSELKAQVDGWTAGCCTVHARSCSVNRISTFQSIKRPEMLANSLGTRLLSGTMVINKPGKFLTF